MASRASRLPSFLACTLQTESRLGLYGPTFGSILLVMIYTLVNDQLVVRICPEPFTRYHANPLEIASAPWLAAYWAVLAACSPGAALGLLQTVLGRWGAEPRVPVGWILRRQAWLLLCVAATAWTVGAGVWITGKRPYPAGCYPDATTTLGITQSVQITAYAVGAIGAAVHVAAIWRKRRLLQARTAQRER